MTTPGSYDASTINPNLDTEVQRLHNQVRLSWEKEARTLAWFGLHNGMSVLELGSGPGFYTEQLLTLLPNSTVTAVEIDPLLIGRAKQYLQGQASERLRMIEADIMETGLPDNSFDFAIGRLVFQHLPDPMGVAKEVLRVLKPGGKLVIISSDRSMMSLVEPPIPEFQLINEKIAQFQASRGGDPFIGRKLWRMLQAVGFQNLDLEAIVSHSDAKGIEAFLPQMNPELGWQMAKLGILSEQEAQSAIASLEKFLASPNPFMLMLWFMACGEKPQLTN